MLRRSLIAPSVPDTATRERPRASPHPTRETARALRPRGARGWLGRHWWALALLAALTWLLLYPYSRRPWQGLASWGDPMLQYWTMAWTRHALATDPGRLFDANIFHPYPHTLAYTDHLLGATLPVLPTIILTGNVTLGLSLAVLLACFLSAAAAYLLVEDLTGNRLAGLAAAVPFGLAPYKLANIAHLNVLTAWGIPLALWAALRLWRGGGRRWAVLLAVAIAWQSLASVYLFYTLLVALGVALLYLLLLERRALPANPRRDRETGGGRARGRGRAIGRLAAGLALGLLLSVPGFWPYWQVSREAGLVRPLDDAVRGAAGPRHYLAVNRNNFLWHGVLERFGAGSSERQLFPGVVAPLLAVVGLLGSRRRERWLFLALALAGFILSLGPYQYVDNWRIPLPYWLLYETVPGFTSMRVPARFVVLVLLGLGGLAGLGVEAIARFARSKVEGRRSKVGSSDAQRAMGQGQPGGHVAPRTFDLRPSTFDFLVAPAALVLLLGAYTLEYRTHLGMTGPVAGMTEAPVYRWLAENGTGPVVELPLPAPSETTAVHNLTSTVHWRPTLNGNSSFVPPAYPGVYRGLWHFPDETSLRLLQGLGVEHIVVHTAELPDWERAGGEAARAECRLREVARFDGDVVYALAPDPWLERLAAAVPPGEPVVLPYVERAGTELELLRVYLRRAGHAVSGSGAVSYHRYSLPEGGRLAPTAFLAADVDPTLYGYLPDEAALSLGGLTMYRRGPGTRAAAMLADPTLPGGSAGSSSFTLRLTGDAIEQLEGAPDAGGGGDRRGEGRAATLAFVNPAAGEVTFHFGGETKREALPAGLVLYRTPPLPTPGTVTVEAPPGGRLYPRWARGEEPAAAGPPGLVATRPVLMVAPSVRRDDGAAMILECTIFPGTTGEDAATPYILSLDIFQHPSGAHPDGHYGNWMVVVPPGDAARRAALTFDIERKAADATLDGAWTSIIAWSGPPERGEFRASLVVTRGDRVLRVIPAFNFELRDWRARYLTPTMPEGGPFVLPPP